MGKVTNVKKDNKVIMDQNSMKQSTTIKALNRTSQYVTQNVFRFLKISLVLVLLYLFRVQESSNPFIGVPQNLKAL